MSDPTEGQVRRQLQERGWQEPALSREVDAVMKGDRFDECPLAAAGFRLVKLSDLPALVIGPDGKCVCTRDRPCMDVDRRDGMRCTLEDLKRLNGEAISRRAWQSGDDW